MTARVLWVCLLIATSLTSTASAKDEDRAVEANNGTTAEASKVGKVFSLFSIVTFKNSGCKSQSTMTSGQSTVRNGTCYTSSECVQKGGTASGNCAAGFGVCCLFLVTTSGSIINQNCTYIRNPNFPSTYSATSALSYTIQKCSSDVCYLRLDFETFTTISATEPFVVATSYTCPDTFKVTTNTGQTIPTICGKNTGQHMYIDMGNLSTDTATIAFTFGTTASTSRTWEIKVSQITCSNPNRPPNGCLQYWSTLTGRITTYNFLTSTTSGNLPSQSYSACIRRAAGYCCIEYQVCAGVPFAFSQDVSTATIVGYTDSYCITDYVAIPGSTAGGCSTTNNALSDKYCGLYLGWQVAIAMGNNFVCDCTSPFEVYFYTNNLGDLNPTTASIISRGDCLDYTQIPCTTN